MPGKPTRKEALLEKKLRDLKRQARETEFQLREAKMRRPQKGLARLYYDFGVNMTLARERTAKSQDKLAKELKMTRTSITNMEAGRQRPPLHVIYRIAKALGVNVYDLLPHQMVE